MPGEHFVLDPDEQHVQQVAQNRQQPRLETLMDIANILDVDVKELIISNRSADKADKEY